MDDLLLSNSSRLAASSITLFSNAPGIDHVTVETVRGSAILDSSEQWLLAETVTTILMEVEELEVEVCYAIGELSVNGGEPGLCIIAKTLRGSVVFIQDRSAQVWLQRCDRNGVDVAGLLKLAESDEPDRLATLCIDTLVAIHDICTTSYLLH